jgi:hypothetical protein
MQRAARVFRHVRRAAGYAANEFAEEKKQKLMGKSSWYTARIAATVSLLQQSPRLLEVNEPFGN